MSDAAPPDAPSDEEAREAERARRDALVAGIAHDVHNLGTHIRASVQTLRAARQAPATGDAEPDGATGAGRGAPPDARAVERALAGIERAAEQASNLVGALAALDRRESRPQAHALDDLAEDAARFLSRWLGAAVAVGPVRDLEHAARAGRVVADLAGLVRALSLLVPTTRPEALDLTLHAVGARELLFEIEAEPGSGADPAPPAAERARAKALLATMDATLPLAFGNGRSTFQASIRLAPAPTPVLTPRPETAHPGPGRAGRALVAEDHAQVRDALIDTLSRCGFEVEAVADGNALVDRATGAGPGHDLLLVDYDLPGCNGARALEALRRAGVKAPALMISGNVDFRLEIEGLPDTDFLQKPFGLADIRRWATHHVPNGQVPEARGA